MNTELYSTLAPYYSANPTGIYDAEVWHYLSVIKIEPIIAYIQIGFWCRSNGRVFPQISNLLVDISEKNAERAKPREKACLL